MATRGATQIKGIIGRNIVAAREQRRMTQHELASTLGTSISRVSGWERGEHMPRNPQAVADVLLDGDVSALYREHDAIPIERGRHRRSDEQPAESEQAA